MHNLYHRWKKLNYDILIPPMHPPFAEMTGEEAQQYFEWFVAQIPNRIHYLAQYSKIKLDYSDTSLIAIWKWFIKHAKIETSPTKRMCESQRQVQFQYPSDMFNAVMRMRSRQFTLETEYILRDVAMYFGEYWVQKHPQLHWGIINTDPELTNFNMPCIHGFVDCSFDSPYMADFEPIHMVHVCASKLLEGQAKPDDLYNLYITWKRMVNE